MPDFSHLLSKPSGEIKAPKGAPAGDYFGVIAGHVFGESRQKKTPYVRFSINNVEPTPEQLQDQQERLADPELNLTKKSPYIDFYLTDDALYRLKDFLDSIGIDDGGGVRSIGERIPEATNHPVQFTLDEQPSQDGKTSYNNIVEIAGRQD